MTGLLGVLLALALLIWLAWRGISVLLLGPVMALLAAAFAAGTPLMATYTQLFMSSAGGFIVQYFPLFLLGALFGKLMDDSGAAEAIAQGIVGKNTFRSPQYTKVDLHIDQEIPLPLLPDGKLVLFADLENVLNLIDSDWGAQRQVNFPQFAPIVNVACLSAAAASTPPAPASTSAARARP